MQYQIKSKKIITNISAFAIIVSLSLPLFLSAQNLEASVTEVNPVIIVATITKYLLGVLGASAIIMFLYGGFMMVFSAGNEEKLKKSRSILVWAIIGITIVLSSYSILNYVFTKMLSSTDGG